MPNYTIAIPSAFTLGNLFSGYIGIVLVLTRGDFVAGFWLILFAAFLDFWDGFLARKLNVAGELGKQLDSLADLVTFGVLPACILYRMMFEGGVFVESFKPYSVILPFFSGLIALGAAWRLAKFNIDEKQSENFIGLATPANAILISSIGMSFQYKTYLYPFFWFNETVLIFIILSIWLMNSKIKLLSLKFKDYSLAKNKFRYLLILISVLSVFFYSFEAIPIVVLVYIGLSIAHFKFGNEI